MNLQNQIFKMYANAEGSDHKLGLETAFKHFIAHNSVNTFDANIVVTGAADVLARSRWPHIIQKLGYKLSEAGKGWGLVKFIVNGQPLIDYAQIYDYKWLAGKYTEVVLFTEDSFTYDDQEYQVFIKFQLLDGKVVKTEQVKTEDGWFIVSEEPIIYPGNTIPVLPMQNNALGKADIPSEMSELLKEFKFYGDQLGVEWEKIKTQFLNNMLYGSGKEAKEWNNDMQEGKSIHDVADPDGKLQGALAPLISGSTTPTLILQNIQYIEDRLLKYSGQFREINASGGNKHNLEISMQNAEAFNYMLNKQAFRQEQLNLFFELAGIEATATVALPVLDQLKIDNMNASVAQAQGQANQYNAQAELNLASAEQTRTQPSEDAVVEGE